MFISTLIAASAAAAQPQSTPPAQPHADHSTMEHGEKKMACCEKMAKGEGCDCCKDMAGKKAGTADGHGGQGGHAH